jgi:hypothetical protein
MSARSICVDCGIDTCPTTAKRGCRHKARWEYYMVHDVVWAKAGMDSDGGHLCIGCLEKRLGRMLRPRDFTGAPINNLDAPWDTERLASRKRAKKCSQARLARGLPGLPREET